MTFDPSGYKTDRRENPPPPQIVMLLSLPLNPLNAHYFPQSYVLGTSETTHLYIVGGLPENAG